MLVEKYTRSENKALEPLKYKVVRVFRKSGRRKVLERGLTIEEAKRLTNSFPNSNTSMVVFTAQ